MPVTFHSDTGQSLYVLFSDPDQTAVDMVEVGGIYTASDADIEAASLPANESPGWGFWIFAGTAATADPSDVELGVNDELFLWDGEQELRSLGHHSLARHSQPRYSS